MKREKTSNEINIIKSHDDDNNNKSSHMHTWAYINTLKQTNESVRVPISDKHNRIRTQKSNGFSGIKIEESDWRTNAGQKTNCE